MTDSETYMTPDQLYLELKIDEIKERMKEGIKREICFQGCSAKNGDGIWEGIGTLQEIMDNYDKNHEDNS